jgi:hypothetical protein
MRLSAPARHSRRVRVSHQRSSVVISIRNNFVARSIKPVNAGMNASATLFCSAPHWPPLLSAPTARRRRSARSTVSKNSDCGAQEKRAVPDAGRQLREDHESGSLQRIEHASEKCLQLPEMAFRIFRHDLDSSKPHCQPVQKAARGL